MSSSHSAALESRHAQLDKQAQIEASRRVPDELSLARLKKEKLRLKDQIAGH